MLRYMRIDKGQLQPFEYDNWYNDIITLFVEHKCNDVMFFDASGEACAYVCTEPDGIYWWSIVHTSAKKTVRQMQLVEIITPVDGTELEVKGVKYTPDISLEYSTQEVELEELANEVVHIMRKAQAKAYADRYAKSVMNKYSHE